MRLSVRRGMRVAHLVHLVPFGPLQTHLQKPSVLAASCKQNGNHSMAVQRKCRHDCAEHVAMDTMYMVAPVKL